MITIEDYFRGKPHTVEQADAAADLLDRVDRLISEAEELGAFKREIDPDTGTEISGSRGGAGDGGFRLSTAATGRTGSAHKCLPADNPAGAAVDPYDPGNRLDNWLDTFELSAGYNTKLEEYDLWREAPAATAGPRGWCHLQTRPASRRTYQP